MPTIEEMTPEEILTGLRERQAKTQNTHIPTRADAEAFKRFCVCFGTTQYTNVIEAYEENLRVMEVAHNLAESSDEYEAKVILRTVYAPLKGHTK